MKTAYGGDQDYYEEEVEERPQKKSNNLPLWGNEKTMNLNSLVLTNIQSSQYFKVKLFQLKTYHEVIDEIYYQVNHLEPWEKGSRVTAGQTGMCGGVRGVGAGGIVSTAFCILYKLFTLRLTRKQVLGLMNHSDSPFIRGLGFMYVRFTQPPADLWDWFEPYLDDEEEIDVRAGGGGQQTTIGDVVRHMLTKLDWYATLFPRIPVPIQKEIDRKLSERISSMQEEDRYAGNYNDNHYNRDGEYNENQRRDRSERDRRERGRDDWDQRERNRDRSDRSYGKERDRDRDRERSRHEKYGSGRSDDRGRDYERDRRKDRKRDRSYDRHSSSSKSSSYRERRDSYGSELEREKERIRKDRRRSRSRSRDRSRKHKREY